MDENELQQQPRKKEAEAKTNVVQALKTIAAQQAAEQAAKAVDAAAKERVAKALKQMQEKGVTALQQSAGKIGAEQLNKLTDKETQAQVEELLEHGDRVAFIAGLVDFFGPEAEALGITSAQHFDRVLEVLQSPLFRNLTLGQIFKAGDDLANNFPFRQRAAAQFLIDCARRLNTFMGGSRDNRIPDQITMGEFSAEMQGSLTLLRPVIDGIRRTNFGELDIQQSLDMAFNGPQTLLIANPLFARFFRRRGITTPAQLRGFDQYCTAQARVSLPGVAALPAQKETADNVRILRDMYARVLEGRSYIAALTHGHQLGFVQSASRIENVIGNAFENSSLTVTDLLQLSLFLQTAVPETEPPTPIPAAPVEGGGAIGVAMLQTKVAHLLFNDNPRAGASFAIHRGYRGLLSAGGMGIAALGDERVRKQAVTLAGFGGNVVAEQAAKMQVPDRLPTISEMQQELMGRLMNRAGSAATKALREWAADGGIERMIEHHIQRRMNVESMLNIMWLKLLTVTTLVENEPATFLPALGILAIMRAFGGHRAWMQWRLSQEGRGNTALSRYAQALETRLMHQRSLTSRLMNPLTFSQTEFMTDSWQETRAVMQQLEVTRQLPERIQRLFGGAPLTEPQSSAIIDIRTMCVDPANPPTRQAVIDRLTQSNCFTPLQAERVVATLHAEGHLPATMAAAPAPVPTPQAGQRPANGVETPLPEDRILKQNAQDRSTRITNITDSALGQHFNTLVISDYRYTIINDGPAAERGIRMESHRGGGAAWSILFKADGTIIRTGAVPTASEALGLSHIEQIHTHRIVNSPMELRTRIPGLTRESSLRRPTTLPQTVPIPAPTPIGSTTGARPGGTISLATLRSFAEHLRPAGGNEPHGLTTAEYQRLTPELRLAYDEARRVARESGAHLSLFDPHHASSVHVNENHVRSWTEHLTRLRPRPGR